LTEEKQQNYRKEKKGMVLALRMTIKMIQEGREIIGEKRRKLSEKRAHVGGWGAERRIVILRKSTIPKFRRGWEGRGMRNSVDHTHKV